MKFGQAQAVKRVEDRRLLTGQGRYTADIDLPGEAHGAVLRSPHAHARIRRLDTGAARAAPGVLAVLTAAEAEADRLADIPARARVKNRDGSDNIDLPRPLLARGKVRHVGEPVAFVVAATLAGARDAAELIEVEYDPLPAVVDGQAALDPGAPLLHDAAPGNLCFHWSAGDEAGTAAAFKKAARVVALDLVNSRVVVAAMEPRAALADCDAATGRATLYSSSQGVAGLQAAFAEVLRLPRAKLRVVTPDVGGGFGMKAFPHPEQGLALWAARRLGRPVKWVGERQEGFLADNQGRDIRAHAELALDGDGRFLALRVRAVANLGAYLSPFAPFVPTQSFGTMVSGLYKIRSAFVEVRGAFTNTAPVDAYRGAGRPEAAYLIERLVDRAARELGVPPAELRRRNFIDRLPHRTAFGDTIDSGDFAAVMDDALARADFAAFPARRAAALARGRLRGIGFACYVERSGGGSDTVRLEFGADDTLEVVVGNQSNGQGHETLYAQMAAARLGIALDRIRVVQGDTDRTPPGFTGGSRATVVGAVAVDGAGAKLIEKGRALAAHLFEAAEADIEYAAGRFAVAGTDRAIGLFELARLARDPARLPAGAEPGLDLAHRHTAAGPTYPNGCHVCELEIDPETGAVALERFVAVDDFGAAINPPTLAGQVAGGIVQGIGQALGEATVYDPASGQLLSASFMDYAIPRAADLPALEIFLHNVPSATNPLGLKAAGEAGAVGATPAAMNALADALAPRGVAQLDMPATPGRVWRWLHPARG